MNLHSQFHNFKNRFKLFYISGFTMKRILIGIFILLTAPFPFGRPPAPAPLTCSLATVIHLRPTG